MLVFSVHEGLKLYSLQLSVSIVCMYTNLKNLILEEKLVPMFTLIILGEISDKEEKEETDEKKESEKTE